MPSKNTRINSKARLMTQQQKQRLVFSTRWAKLNNKVQEINTCTYRKGTQLENMLMSWQAGDVRFFLVSQASKQLLQRYLQLQLHLLLDPLLVLLEEHVCVPLQQWTHLYGTPYHCINIKTNRNLLNNTAIFFYSTIRGFSNILEKIYIPL